MSDKLNDKQTNATRPRYCYRRDAFDRSRDWTPKRRPTETMTAEEEMAFVAKGVLALLFLAVIPLMLFLIIHYFQLGF